MLGGLYGLVAMGLTLQYGVARIMNLSYGEFLIAPAFLAFFAVSSWGISPLLLVLLVVPLGFAIQWLIYQLLLTPLVRRAKGGPALEVDSILATFGMLFVVQGVMLVMFGGDYHSYSYLADPVEILGSKVAANRRVPAPWCAPCPWHLSSHIWSASMCAARRPWPTVWAARWWRSAACWSACFCPSRPGMLLGFAETLVASFVDPGLTLAVNYAVFLLVLLFKPTGLFGRTAR